MPLHEDGAASASDGARRLRLAAAADVHVSPGTAERVAQAFAEVAADVDAILLAGDLTTHGEPEQAALLRDACRGIGVPVVTVLGNHDLHSARRAEVVATLEEGGVIVLERSHVVLEVGGCELGIAGAKGFVGGFPGCYLPDFGEPSLRAVYAEATQEVTGLDRALRAIAHCPFRVALLHYAPITATLEGEPREIWAFLGTDRLAPPIMEHAPDLVLHGHAHAGRFRGDAGGVPVFNVSVPVMDRDFWVFELAASPRPAAPIH